MSFGSCVFFSQQQHIKRRSRNQKNKNKTKIATKKIEENKNQERKKNCLNKKKYTFKRICSHHMPFIICTVIITHMLKLFKLELGFITLLSAHNIFSPLCPCLCLCLTLLCCGNDNDDDVEQFIVIIFNKK